MSKLTRPIANDESPNGDKPTGEGVRVNQDGTSELIDLSTGKPVERTWSHAVVWRDRGGRMVPQMERVKQP